MSRNEERQLFTLDGRMILAEQDADAMERSLDAFKREIRSEVRAIKSLLIGVMVSAVTATIVGAINLIYQRVGAG